MSENAYHELREFLNQFPRGFLETESGAEIKILKAWGKEPLSVKQKTD